MVIVQDKIDDIVAGTDYVNNSIFCKSSSATGCTYKWLEYIDAPTNSIATRKQCFIATNTSDAMLSVEQRRVLNDVLLDEAS